MQDRNNESDQIRSGRADSVEDQLHHDQNADGADRHVAGTRLGQMADNSADAQERTHNTEQDQ